MRDWMTLLHLKKSVFCSRPYDCRLRSTTNLSSTTRYKFTIAFENRPSTFGTGVFACQNVSKGEVVWNFDDNECIRWVEKIKAIFVWLFFILRIDESSIKHYTESKLKDILYKGYLNLEMDKVKIIIKRHETVSKYLTTCFSL